MVDIRDQQIIEGIGEKLNRNLSDMLTLNITVEVEVLSNHAIELEVIERIEERDTVIEDLAIDLAANSH